MSDVDPDMSHADPEWEAEVKEQMIDPMIDSAIVMSIFSGAIDWKIAIEIGAAVLLDKPIVLCLTDASVAVPKHLAAVTDAVLLVDAPDFKKDLKATLKEMNLL